MNDMPSQKLAIITGASRGIGEATALAFANEGYAIGLLARDEERLNLVAKKIKSLGLPAVVAACDLSDAAQTQKAVEKITAVLGVAQVVVHNAGLVLRKSTEECSMSEVEYLMRLNLHAPIQITKLLLPAMRARGCGTLIYISSISGKMPLPGGSIYAASKYGLTGFAESLLGEVRDDNIRVCTVFPGSVKREGEDQSTDWKLDPEDIAKSCVFLNAQASNACVHHLEVRPLNKNL